MILLMMIFIPILGGLLAWWISRWQDNYARWTCLFALAVGLLLSASAWWQSSTDTGLSVSAPWLMGFSGSWVPQLGISFTLGIDGMSLLLVTLTFLLGFIAVLASWKEIKERVGFFHFNVMWALSGIVGVFVALDLFLFFFFWEMMLIPMYFLIALWGHEQRRRAAMKFFLFTQAGGLIMLVSILALYFAHGHSTGHYSFAYADLLDTPMSLFTSLLIMSGFIVAFAVKLPLVPFHTWLPDAHTQAPTAGSVILAGLLLKTAAYGFLRFVIPLFPEAAVMAAPVGMVLGVVNIIYGAVLAFAQTDFKRLVAYTSVSHMGFVILGLCALNGVALQGVLMQMLCHGLSTGGLFVIAGLLQERLLTRDMDRMGGFWQIAPRLGAVTLFLSLASLGMPGLGNFIAEFMVLLGSFRVNSTAAVLAGSGLVLSAVYSLNLVQKVFHGPCNGAVKFPDLSLRESAPLLAVLALLAVLGWYPQPVLDKVAPALGVLKGTAISTGNTGTRPPVEDMQALSVSRASSSIVYTVSPAHGHLREGRNE